MKIKIISRVNDVITSEKEYEMSDAGYERFKSFMKRLKELKEVALNKLRERTDRLYPNGYKNTKI